MDWHLPLGKRAKARKAFLPVGEALAAQFGDGSLEQILDSISIMVCLLAPDGTTRFVNRAAEQLTGFNRNEIVGQNWWELVSPKGDPEQAERLSQATDQGNVTDFEIRITTKDGEPRTVLWSAIGFYDDNGKLLSIVGSGDDITHRRWAEDALEGQQAFLDNIINSVADPIFVKDRQHRWIILNDACCEFMGYTREELLGKSDHDFFPKEEADVFLKKDNEVFASGVVNTNEELFTDANGTRHIIATKKAVFRNPGAGDPVLVGVFRDVTQLKRLEQQLNEKLDELEAMGSGSSLMDGGDGVNHSEIARPVSCKR